MPVPLVYLYQLPAQQLPFQYCHGSGLYIPSSYKSSSRVLPDQLHVIFEEGDRKAQAKHIKSRRSV